MPPEHEKQILNAMEIKLNCFQNEKGKKEKRRERDRERAKTAATAAAALLASVAHKHNEVYKAKLFSKPNVDYCVHVAPHTHIHTHIGTKRIDS